MNPPRGHRHAHRDPEQVRAQRRWVAPAQHGGYREVPEPGIHHAIDGCSRSPPPPEIPQKAHFNASNGNLHPQHFSSKHPHMPQ